MCVLLVYIFLPVCIDGAFHALWLAVMSQPEDYSLLIIFALFHLVLLSHVDSFIAINVKLKEENPRGLW